MCSPVCNRFDLDSELRISAGLEAEHSVAFLFELRGAGCGACRSLTPGCRGPSFRLALRRYQRARGLLLDHGPRRGAHGVDFET